MLKATSQAKCTAQRRFPGVATALTLALPAAHEAMQSAATIFARIGIGALSTTRQALRLLERDGVAVSILVATPRPHGGLARLYRLAEQRE
ncbi:MAG: hypothetical protein ACRECA_13950 [Pseudolabrys sp.]